MNGKLLVVAVLGVFLAGFAAISHAGGAMHKADSSGTGKMATMERSAGVEQSSSDSWQYFEAVETGNFPSRAETSREPAREGPPILWVQPQSPQTVGGLEFRDVEIGP